MGLGDTHRPGEHATFLIRPNALAPCRTVGRQDAPWPTDITFLRIRSHQGHTIGSRFRADVASGGRGGEGGGASSVIITFSSPRSKKTFYTPKLIESRSQNPNLLHFMTSRVLDIHHRKFHDFKFGNHDYKFRKLAH